MYNQSIETSIIQIAAYLPRSTANGPGIRSVVWVQGCPLRCFGCFNPDFQLFNGGEAISTIVLSQRLLAEQATEGVSFSGGEPFAQAAALAEVACAMHAVDKGVLIFTGFYYESLQKKVDAGIQRLLAYTDLLVAGPYQQNLLCNHPLLASSNQQLVYLTDRYRNVNLGTRRIEYHISNQGLITVTGFPNYARTENLHRSNVTAT